MSLTRAWRKALCLAVCKTWFLATISTRAWRLSLCRTVCKAWPLVTISTRAWRLSLCRTVCKAWPLVTISTRAWRTSLCRTGLTFGDNFDQSLEIVTLPDSLQSLTFGDNFDQSLKNVSLPDRLDLWWQFRPEPGDCHFAGQFAKLDLWWQFRPEPEERLFARQAWFLVTISTRAWRTSLCRTGLTFGDNFDQSLEIVTLPDSLQSLTFGDNFDQSLKNVSLPDRLDFWWQFRPEPEERLFAGQAWPLVTISTRAWRVNVTLPCSLQSLTFGDNFNQSLKNVSLPDRLDLWWQFRPEPGELMSLYPAVCKAWFLVTISTRAWRTSLCRTGLTFGDNFDQSLES